MYNYRVTIPEIDLVDVPITAASSKKAALRALIKHNAYDALDLDKSLEITVESESTGRKVIYEALPILAHKFTKVG